MISGQTQVYGSLSGGSTLSRSRGSRKTHVAQHYAPHILNSDQLVISIKEARKLLGQDGKSLSDSQVIELIQTLTVVADDFLQNLGSINYNGN